MIRDVTRCVLQPSHLPHSLLSSEYCCARVQVGRLDKSHGGIGQLCVRGDQRVFASAGWDNRTRVFCLKTLTPVAILRHHRDSVNAVAFSSNNSSLASGSKDGKLCLWDVLPRISKSKLQPRKMADIAGL